MILIVNDSPDILWMLREKLGEENCIQAIDGLKAFDIFTHNRHLIKRIISDYHMPIMNGLEFVTKVRAVDLHIPIEVYSAAPDARQVFAHIPNLTFKEVCP